MATTLTAELEPMFEDVAARLLRERTDVERARMLHSAGLRSAGSFFAFTKEGELVVKLPAERVEELIAGGQGAAFDRGRGRPLKQWVRLRPTDAAACAAYLDQARRFVAPWAAA